MRVLTILYVANATLLLLHEIDSAYEKEWEILKLPGKISGFLLIHVPIVALLIYGIIPVYNNSRIGLAIAIVTGAGGVLPLMVHKLILPKQGKFEGIVSNVIMYGNAAVATIVLFLSIRLILSH